MRRGCKTIRNGEGLPATTRRSRTGDERMKVQRDAQKKNDNKRIRMVCTEVVVMKEEKVNDGKQGSRRSSQVGRGVGELWRVNTGRLRNALWAWR